MNIALWVLQIPLALHTLMGAVWKFSHSAEKTMPSLKAIPPGVWLAMSVVEILCTLGLILPAFYNPLPMLASASAAVIAAEMILLCVLHLASGSRKFGPMTYWLVVAVWCGIVAYGRSA